MLLCATKYQERVEPIKFLQSTDSIEERIRKAGLTGDEFHKKLEKRLARVGIDFEEFIRKEEEIGDNRKITGKEGEINHD